ncbi:unnamed protein product [Blepharisma stoltei]|uniref:Integrase catalytic domain-containing protein n=1 Tax=Blepharisma stoltei TaxID=1481888 RepID=A0AAU9IF64_9CILI|nr:unnamed protein product [Blepharisma stoltei]
MDLFELTDEIKDYTNYRYVLSIIDHFSKYTWAYPIASKTAELVLNNVEHLLNSLPKLPDIIQTDNGSEFANKSLETFCERFQIRVIHSSSYNPRAQGTAENINKYLHRYLWRNFKQQNSQQDWKIHSSLFSILNFYNKERRHTITGFKPHEVFFATDQSLFVRVKENVENKKSKSTKLHKNFSLEEIKLYSTIEFKI